MLNKNLLFVFLLVAINISAQEILTPEQAIEIALKNNYDILLVRNEVEIAQRNNSIGNAGMLPTINATLGDNFSLTNLNQQFTNGTEINRNDVKGNNINAGIALNWTLFDGLKMFATKSKLKRLEEIGELNFKEEVQAVVENVLNTYYNVVSAQQQLKAIEEAIKISEERVKLADAKFQVGNSSKVDLLQAKVDLNAQKSNLLSQKKTIEQRKGDLNSLLSRNIETEFLVLDTIPFTEPKIETELDKNLQLQAALKNVEVAKFQKKEVFSQFLPNLLGSVGYTYSRSQSDAGFSLYNQTYGLGAGFSLNIPLFNGLNTIRQNKIAAIQITSMQFNAEKVRFQTKLSYYKALKDFATAKEQLRLEEENILLADENQKIALERFRLSQSTAIELREAQKSFVDAQSRLVAARYAAKVAETGLLRLQGELVK